MNDLWKNSAVWIPIIIWFMVQFYKFLHEIFSQKKIDIRRMWGSGGMPSAHSALVCSLATVCGLREGISSTEFAICLVLAGVVMYDAAGVRRAVGKQARVLNQIIENGDDVDVPHKLIELIGHSPKEVIVGALVGILFSVLFYKFVF